MNTKPPKPKKCKSCGNPFIPQRPLQSVCSPLCGLELTRERNKKKLAQEWKKEKSELKEKLRTKSDYEKDLQKEINHIARLIDRNWECISSGRKGNFQNHGGHLLSTAAFPALRFNLFNIYLQSAQDNNHKSGNPLEYANRLVELFGQDHYDMIMALKGKYPFLKLSIDDLKEKISIARGQVKWLLLQDKDYSLEERLTVRQEINEKIGIYI